MESIKIQETLLGQPFGIESGTLARLADGSVTITWGDNVLLATACMNKEPNLEAGWFPLTVEYQERFYAVGKIKGGRFMKREGKPSDDAVLNARLTDRPLRPLFPSGMVNDVQVIITVLSADEKSDLGAMAITAASAAVMKAGIPFGGPVSGVRVGLVDGQIIVNPTNEEAEKGDLDLIVAGTKDAILMVEAGAKMVSEEIMLKAMEEAHAAIKQLCELQGKFLSKFDIVEKEVYYNLPDESLISEVQTFLEKENLLETLFVKTKVELNEKETVIKKKVVEQFQEKIDNEDEELWTEQKVNMGLFKVIKKFIRKNILESDKRLDSRALNEIRPIDCKAGLLPRTHGSGVFTRGDTQSLSVVTLGAPGDAQLVDTMEGEEYSRRYMHHYNMPPYSVGEVRFMRGPNRREIGHGYLAERAILPVLPEEKDFPYTIRVVSELVTSNGSTSMASTCGSTLSLMDAGVPIKSPVSGIAMGLISDENGKYKVLSDIQGIEDFTGDMDFKVTGPKEGITGLQMDMKIQGITMDILKDALAQAHEGRMFILGEMLKVLPEPRKELSPLAPKIISLQIKPDQIRDVIGSGGKVINGIIDATGVDIDISDDGLVSITASNQESGEKALRMVKDITYVPNIGDVIEGKVTRIENFGAFVEINPNLTGLIHISQLMPFRVENINDYVKMRQMMKAKVISIDEAGKIALSHKEFAEKK